MKDKIENLIDISQRFGKNADYIIAGGGNTSFKTEDKIWVKASGTSMSEIDENGFVCLDRGMLKILSTKNYSENPSEREKQVKLDLENAILFPKDKRPSVETSMHDIIRFPFVVHTHPTLVNGLLCAKNSRALVEELFGKDVIYIAYTDPGYVLFKAVEDALKIYRGEKGFESAIILLENHGVFVGAETTEKINEIYLDIEKKLLNHISSFPKQSKTEENSVLNATISRLGNHYETERLSCRTLTNDLTTHFVSNIQTFTKVNVPFTPDNIVYCKSNYLYIRDASTIIFNMLNFKHQFGYFPRIVAVEGHGIIALEENEKSAKIALDVFQDMMKVSYLTENFGGPRPMTKSQIDFIDNWEVENYRRQVSKSS